MIRRSERAIATRNRKGKQENRKKDCDKERGRGCPLRPALKQISMLNKIHCFTLNTFQTFFVCGKGGEFFDVSLDNFDGVRCRCGEPTFESPFHPDSLKDLFHCFLNLFDFETFRCSQTLHHSCYTSIDPCHGL